MTPTRPGQGETGKGYDAFVSYSHSADGELAPALQAGLQRFARSWRQRRALEVFRDETGLAVNPDLWRSICTAMDGSEWFVLLCSPGAAASEWVGKEIERWVETRGADRLLPVVTEGTFVWDDREGDIDLERSTAAHPALRGVFSAEPRHIDMSWARSDTDLTLRNARFRDQIAEIAAPMHGTTKDELEGEDVRRQRQVRRLVRGAVAVLVVLTLAATASAAVAVRNGREAARQRDEAEAQQAEAERQAREATSQRLATLSQGATGALQPLLAVQAHRMAATPQATGAMVVAATTGSEGVVARLAGHTGGVVDVDHAPDGSLIATVDSTGAVRAFDRAGEPLGSPADLGAVAVAALDGDTVAAATPEGLALVGAGEGDADEVVDLGAGGTAVARLDDGAAIVGLEDGTVARVGAGGEVTARADGAHRAPVRFVGASDDGSVVVSFASTDPGDGAGPPDGGSVVSHAPADLAEAGSWSAPGAVLALTPDGTALAVAPAGPEQAADGSFAMVRLVDPATGAERAVLGGVDFYVARGADVAPDGSTIVVATTGGADGAPGQAFALPTDGGERAQLLPVQMEATTATSVSPDGRTAVAAGSDVDAAVLAIGGDDLGGVVPLDGAAPSVPLSASTATGLVAVDLDGGGVGVADSRTGEVTPVAPGATAGAAVSPDGTRLLTSDGVHSLPGGEPVGGGAPGPGGDVAVAFSSDGARAAYPVAGGDEVVVVDLGTGEVLGRHAAVLCEPGPDCALAGLALSDDGALLAVHPSPADGGSTAVALVTEGEGWAVGAEVPTDGPGPVAFEGDRLLVQAGPTVTAHELPDLEATGSGRTSEVSGRWARAGEGLAVTGPCDVDLVDRVSLRAVADVPVEALPTEGGCLVDGLGAAWADPAGTVLLTTYRDGLCDDDRSCPLQRWDLDPDRLAERLCASAGRDLTRDEWAQFLPGWEYEATCPERPADGEASDGDPDAPDTTDDTDDEEPAGTTEEPTTTAPEPTTGSAPASTDGPASGTAAEQALVDHLAVERPGLLTAASGPCDDPTVPGGVTCHVTLVDEPDQVVMGVGYPQSELLVVYRLEPDGTGWLVAEEHGLSSGEPTPPWAQEALGG